MSLRDKLKRKVVSVTVDGEEVWIREPLTSALRPSSSEDESEFYRRVLQEMIVEKDSAGEWQPFLTDEEASVLCLRSIRGEGDYGQIVIEINALTVVKGSKPDAVLESSFTSRGLSE